MKLSVIVPAYNEEKNLFFNIIKYNDYLKRQNYDYEIIVVNDGSIDKTRAEAEKLQSKIKNLKIINFTKNKGKGTAVCRGLLEASGKIRLFIDADNATSIEHIEKIWDPFNGSHDIVIGSRNPRDAKGACQTKPQIFLKRILGISGNRLIQLLAVKGIYDTQCGFKAFSEKAVKKIIPKVTINRWGFDAEILAIANIYDYKIAKIPITWVNSKKSRVGIMGYFTSLLELIKIKYNLIKNKY